MTANEVERETLFSYFINYPHDFDLIEKNVIKRIPYDGLVYSIFYINDIKVVHVEPEMTGSHSKGGTAETLRKALKRVRPTFVVSLGVGFGYDIDRESLCDVMVGRQFFAYDKSVKFKNNEINVKRLHTFESDQALLCKIKSTIKFEDKTKGIFDNSFNAYVGNLITGEYVVDSRMYRDIIFSPFKPFGVIGGEMEAFGMFSVIEEYNRQPHHFDTHGIMIKGICDWAAGKNADTSNEEQEKGTRLKERKDIVEQINQIQELVGVELEDVTDNDAKIKMYERLSSDEKKNNLQVLAMCNACTICKMFLKESSLFSDYHTYGVRKFLNRIFNGLVRPLRNRLA